MAVQTRLKVKNGEGKMKEIRLGWLWGLSLLTFGFSVSAGETPRLIEQWSCAGLDTPESVLYDSERDILYVSNISGDAKEKNGTGFISQVSVDGTLKTLKWASDLDAPKGMAIHGNRLYVSDIDQLVAIDLKTGKVLNRYPAEGAGFLNDVATDTAGHVYVSDSSENNSVIYRLANETLDVWLRDPAVSRPNGLHMLSDRLLVGNATSGDLHAVMLDSGSINSIATDSTGIDGLKPFGGGYLISNWGGKTSWITASGETVLLLDTTAEKVRAADFEYIAALNLLIIPTFSDDRVVAYKVSQSPSLQEGSSAPAIQAIDQNGLPWTLEKHTGTTYVVLYFYPAAMTGGCTAQACSYRDFKNKESDLDIEIVGISGDTSASLKLFQQANHLNFTLLSDPDGSIAKRYGVPVRAGKKSIQRTVDGKKVVLERSNTTARWTFIVDPQGKVIHINKQVKAATDRNAVIEFIRNHEAL